MTGTVPSGTPAEILNIGREQVHAVETGPRDGPVLLLSSGLGGAWFDWRPSVELLRERHRVIVFDRPGLGLSPAAVAAPSLRRDTAILAALAGRAGRPVVVLAHSMAAFHAEALARRHPDLVRALVLIDPSTERDPRAPVRLARPLHPLTKAAGAVLGATRLARVLGPLGRRMVLKRTSRRDEPVPASVVRSVYGRGTVLGTVMAEEIAYREMAADLESLRERRPFPPVPLAVITALGDVKDPEKAREWSDGHRLLAAMSPHGSQVELPDALHMVHLDRPDAVADAVAAVLARRAEETARPGETA
ncbi:alpha/beta hydrolase [Actinomadura graeca]|uniref:Alpha/beta hydrolase n=1 Tax=Actinomadura graeca TaxID=2750812 RepID=A0ABX8R0S4_9ACTN|nr:alpha/beta hydrolase [Actinomadura graeca]QXJ24146.1 alpha/beta hydrolase [Actinomadura graeca]